MGNMYIIKIVGTHGSIYIGVCVAVSTAAPLMSPEQTHLHSNRRSNAGQIRRSSCLSSRGHARVSLSKSRRSSMYRKKLNGLSAVAGVSCFSFNYLYLPKETTNITGYIKIIPGLNIFLTCLFLLFIQIIYVSCLYGQGRQTYLHLETAHKNSGMFVSPCIMDSKSIERCCFQRNIQVATTSVTKVRPIMSPRKAAVSVLGTLRVGF